MSESESSETRPSKSKNSPAPENSAARTYPISMLDVFAEGRLAGNQLAVVHDAQTLSDDEMQAIALETNFSETTFVTQRSDKSADVRIFTPSTELPFAGHPTVGTAWELTQGEGEITLNLVVGAVRVEFIDGIGWMTPPEVELGDSLDLETAAELVGLTPEQLDATQPAQFAQVGPEFLIIPIASLDALRQARLNNDLRLSLLAQGLPARSVFLFTDEAYSQDADVAARMFFDAGGVREDPATGSANTAFAAYLRAHRGDLGDVVVDQGVEINRPSRLYLKVGPTIQVGGKVQPVVSGKLHL